MPRSDPVHLAVAYMLFMIYAGGLTFILLSAVLFASGMVLNIIALREQGKPVFERATDWITFAVIVIAGICGVYGLSTGSAFICSGQCCFTAPLPKPGQGNGHGVCLDSVQCFGYSSA